ncbi:MAG: oligosaccharide repeat unit polymerase [bacterium]|nr:oligosaccharide repeat unit polymerase [bacterium]
MLHLSIGTFVIVAFLAAGSARRLSPFSPLMLGALAWLGVFACGLVLGDRFYPITDRALALWLAWFVVSGLFHLFLAGPGPMGDPAPERSLPFDYSLPLLLLVAWLLFKMRQVGLAGPAEFFSNLRLSSTENAGLESLGPVARFYPLVFALFLFEHINACGANRRRRLLLWGLMSLFALATMGKLTALTPILGWAVVRDVRARLPLRRLLLLVPAVFALLFALHLARALVGEQVALARFLGVYVYSPLVALGYMASPVDSPFGAHVFRFAYVMWDAVIGGVSPVPVVQPYVAVPLLTNVYTVIQPFALDFGATGVVLGAVFYGLFFGLLHRAALARRQLALMLYGGLSMVVFGQFIGEFLFTMLSGHLQFLLAAVVIHGLARETPPAVVPQRREVS